MHRRVPGTYNRHSIDVSSLPWVLNYPPVFYSFQDYGEDYIKQTKLVNPPARVGLINASEDQLRRPGSLSSPLPVPFYTAPPSVPPHQWSERLLREFLFQDLETQNFLSCCQECSLQSTLSIIKRPALGFRFCHWGLVSLTAVGDLNAVKIKAISFFLSVGF